MLAKRFFKTRDEVEVTFQIARDAAFVELVVDAFGWDPLSMKRTGRSGPFKLRVRLPKNGAVQFRYLLDGGHWDNDEAADEYWPNEHGSDNSVVLTAGVALALEPAGRAGAATVAGRRS